MSFDGKNKVHSIYYEKTNTDRQFLKIKLKVNPSKSVLVIMKNPSTTCNNLQNGNYTISRYTDMAKCHIDRSTGKVLRKLKNIYDEINIINLYSLYDSKPSGVDAYYYGSNRTPAIFCQNNLRICSFLNSYSGDVICAWGKANGIRQGDYDKQIKCIESLFNNNHNLLEYEPKSKCFISRTDTKYPPHGLTWK